MAGTRHSYKDYLSNGSQVNYGIVVDLGYIDRSHIHVYRYVAVPATDLPTLIEVPFTFLNANTITLTAPVSNGQYVRVLRSTPSTSLLVDFTDGSIVSASNLDTSSMQAICVAQEAQDLAQDIRDQAAAVEDVSANALSVANAAKAAADNAVIVAGNANSTAAAANSTAVAAQATANSALTAAGNAVTTANNTIAVANAANATANTANSTANTANSKADAAVATANAVDGKATTALNNSIQATNDAANAVTVANGVDGKATTALNNSNAAVSTANNAIAIAQGIDGKAQSALDASSAATTTANNANAKADAAVSTANGIDAKAQSALDASASATSTANAATTNINTFKSDVAANSNTAAKGAKLMGYGVWSTSFRTVHAKLSERLSVLDFGADPTGATSSSAAFTAAAANYPNYPIHVPAGTYAGVGGSNISGLGNTWLIDRGVTFPAAIKINGETDLNWLPGKVFSQLGNAGFTGSSWKIGKGGLWLEQMRANSQAISEFCVVSTNGNYGVIGASRSSDNSAPNSQSAIGVGAFANNDNTAQTKPVWAAYMEPVRQPNTGPAFGIEIDSRNYGNTVSIDPYSAVDFTPANSPVVNLWMSTGGGDAGGSPSASSSPMVILPNPAKFQTGITFRNGSINDGRAINVPVNYKWSWWSAAGTSVSEMYDKKHVFTVGGDTNIGGQDYFQVYAQRTMSGFSHLTGGQCLYEIVANGYAGLGTGYQLGGIFRWIKEGPYTTNNATYAELYLGGTGGSGSLLSYTFGNSNFRPSSTDGSVSLGLAGNRWSQVWAVTGTIQTSDERQKQDIGELPGAVLDAWADVNFVQFRWKDAVTEKGDGARLHAGVIAQQVIAAFEAHGVDPYEYGLICVDQWPEQQEVWEEHESTLPDGTKEVNRVKTKEYRPAGDLIAVRYDQALVLEAALMRRTQQRLEARLSALE